MNRFYLFISIFFIHFIGYAQCDLTLTFDINKIDSLGNESEYSGFLCNNEKIKLINTSNHQSTCPNCFSWVLPGVPADSLVIDPILGTAEFSYSEDAFNESFTLNYTDPTAGLCNDSKDSLINVNVDYINPILSDDLIQLSCSFDTIIELDHETLLDSDIADYIFSWTLLYNTSIASVTPPSPSNIEAPQFIVNSTESQFYGIELQISNPSSGCSGILTDPNFFKISAFDNSIQSNSTITCLPNMIDISTQNDIIIDSYEWNLYSNGSLVSNNNSSSISINLDTGIYDVQLITETIDGCINQIDSSDFIQVNNYTAEISAAPDSICFQGSATTSQAFSATITSDSLGIEYEVISYEWSIISSNSASAVQTPIDSLNVSYTFSEPGVYSLMYSASIDGSNTDCAYADTIDFEVGINTSIKYDEIICVGGNTFNASFGDLDTWSTGLSYEWSTTSDLVITSPSDSITSISSVTPVLPDSTLVYDLNLRVTNDVGCWEEDSVDIDVYEVRADFTVSDSVLHCLSQEDTLISLHNNHINTWNWTVVDGDGISHTNPNPLTASTYIHLFESYGNSDVTLILTSDHGCSDIITYSDVIYVNNYTAEISAAPDSICFQGSATTSQAFSATITSDSLGIEYEVISYEWSIISSNSASAVQTPIDSLNVSYTFSEPGVYSLMYSASIDGSNTDCAYADTIDFEVGINTSIKYDEIICVGGNTFNASFGDLDTWSTGLSYEWSTTSDLVITSPSDSITSISSVTPVLPDSTLVYDLNLKVTNDVGCWEENSVDIDVYEVHADFFTSHEGELCFSQIINFQSLHNDFISSYEWSYLGIKYDGNILDSIYTDDNDSIQFDEMGIYSFSLSLISEQGCVDSLTKDSIFDIKRPYPIWSLDENNGCDELSLSIVDSSIQVTEVFYYSEYYAPELDSIYTLTTYDSISPYLQIIDTIAVLLDTSYLDSTYLSLNETVFNSFDISSIFSDSILVLDTFYLDTIYTVVYDTLPNILQSEPPQQYLLNNVNNFDYLFPYNEIGEDTVEYVYPIKLKTSHSHEGCFDYLYDTITVFATPIIETSFSADTGCFPNHSVDFFDHSKYVDSESAEYFWDFGDGNFSNDHNPTHTFIGIPGDTAEYEVTLTIETNNDCIATKEITTVKVYANPLANFDYTSGPFCYGLADVEFSDSTSILTTSDPLDSVIWTYNGDETIEESNEDFVILDSLHDGTGTYEVSLEIVDIHGCRGTYTDSISIVELDTIVSLPILNYVSWTDTGMIINFAESQDDNFSHLEVWQQPENIPGWFAADLNIDYLTPNYYVHDNIGTSLSASSFVNNYYIRQIDSCGYESDTSINHSSILLQANSYDYQDIQISWTRYRGWNYIYENDSVVADSVDIIYEIYRSENNLDFERIISIEDTLPFIDGSFTYIDKDLCNLNYTYYVLAKHPLIDEFQSRSNKVNLEPMFVDFNQSPILSYSTVNLFDLFTVNGQVIEDYIVTEWEEWDQSDMNYYKIDRYDAFYGWQEEVGIMGDSLFVDYDVDVYNDEYLYRVSYHDDCGNSSPESNFGSNILLKGTQHKSHYDLNWNAYKKWEGGVRNYIIEYYQHQDNVWIDLETLSGTTLDYIDSDLQKDSLSIAYDFMHGVDTSYCYRVKAISYSDIMSYSNEYCFIAEPTNYFPNAFSPNNDGINDKFEYRFKSYEYDENNTVYSSSFVKSINLQIFNKWGNLVFETNDLDFQWDGNDQNNGEVCPQGAYVISYEMIGFNGSVISDKGIIYLLR